MQEHANVITSSRSGYTSKAQDLGSFELDITIKTSPKENAMLDSGAGINMIPYSVYEKLRLSGLKPTFISLRLVNQSSRNPRGVIEDVVLKVDRLLIPTNFIVLDIKDRDERGNSQPVLLGRPFIATFRAIVDVNKGNSP